MLNSAEHEILNAHKYKKYQEIQLFSGSDKPRMLIFLPLNIEMPTIFGILTFMRRKKFMLSRVKHENFITSGPWYQISSETPDEGIEPTTLDT